MPSSNAVVRDFKEKATNTLEIAKEKVFEKGIEAGKHVDEHAHKKPWFYVGIFSFFWAFFGFFLGKKSKH